MGRYLSILLITLALLVAGVAAEDKKDDKEKPKAPAPSSDDSRLPEGYDPKELENDVFIKSDGSSSCPDATEYDYEDVSNIMKTMTDNAETAIAVENGRNSNDSLEFVKVNKAEKRIGCGTYYLMAIKTKDHSSTAKGGERESTYDLEYFVSDYEKHLVKCEPKDKWSYEPKTNSTSKQNGPCQEPSANKYEKVDKITKEVISYANLALLAQNIEVTTMLGFEKIEKLEKRPGCGTYYRLHVTVKDKDNGGKESSYELEYYQNKDSFKHIYFLALPPKQ